MAWINSKIEDLLNYRIEQEEYSGRLYLGMSKWLVKNGYEGASKLFKKWSLEEFEHAGYAYEFLEDMNIQPKVQAILQIDANFSGLRDIMQKAFDHEMMITEQCNELAKACMDESDFVTFTLAGRYTMEQAEELAKTTYWLDRIDAFSGDSSLLIIDKEMGE